MIHIASAFDKNYLARAHTMYRSLVRFLPDATYWFLCLDRESLDLMNELRLPNVRAVLIDDMGDRELMAVRPSRTLVEFAMTAKPAWISSLISSNRIAPGDQLALVDVDIMFYQDPKPFLARISAHPISITPHWFSPKKRYLDDAVGIYNSGLIFFTKTPESVRCAAEWRAQCIKWCSTTKEPGLYTDQRYLNDWPAKYSGIYEIPDKGVNTGTWNIKNFKVARGAHAGEFTISGDPLICYHFHGLKIYRGRDGSITAYPISIYDRAIYQPCMRELTRSYAELATVRPGWNAGLALKLSPVRYLKQSIQRLML